MASASHERCDRKVEGCLAAGGADSTRTALEPGDPFLQDGNGRVGNARIDVTGAF